MGLDREPLVVELNDRPEYQRLLDGQAQTYGIKVGRVHLAAGASCGEHTTGEREEVLIFLAGSGRMLIGEQCEAFEVGVGKVSYIPPKTLHDIQNTGADPLVYVFCVAPAAAVADPEV
ncbi:MAG TPA: cupin domain-containing protein [Phycisphaerales bacterium]|nr:cupin domain-containing protein [Phycisphaerales bacterium]